MELPLGQLAEIATNGSPVLLHAVGRMFGLGQVERQSLFANGLPRWSVYLLVASAGLIAGAYAHKRWPREVDRALGGNRR